jgi:hypothetical protein
MIDMGHQSRIKRAEAQEQANRGANKWREGAQICAKLCEDFGESGGQVL